MTETAPRGTPNEIVDDRKNHSQYHKNNAYAEEDNEQKHCSKVDQGEWNQE